MHIAIVGATGAVGRELCAILDQRAFPFERLTLLASERSAGAELTVGGKARKVAPLRPGSLQDVDIALFSAGSAVTRPYRDAALRGKAVLIDNSSAFRMDPEVPLVIPEVNPQDAFQHRGLIANPNCSTIIMAVVVWPLHRIHRVRRIVVSTYQAASGAGAAAMQELLDQSGAVLKGLPAQTKVFPHPIAFNLFSHNSAIDDSGCNEEERKMVHETRKMFHEPDLRITATCVRVPVLRTHSESLNLTFEEPITPEEVREILSSAPGVRVVDDRARNHFPMPVEASGGDDVLVGRIRQDRSQPCGRGIDLFICGDQLRKGAALNAVQIAELLIARPRPLESEPALAETP